MPLCDFIHSRLFLSNFIILQYYLFHRYWDLHYEVLSLVSLVGRTVYFHSRSLPIFEMWKNLSMYEIKVPYHGKCLNNFYSLVAMHQKLTRLLRSLVRFLCFATRELKSFVHIFHGIISIYRVSAVTRYSRLTSSTLTTKWKDEDDKINMYPCISSYSKCVALQ